MRQFMLIDAQLYGFCAIWTAPAAFATIAIMYRRTPAGLRLAATVYVFLLCIGSWIAPMHNILPGLGGDHHGATDFANRWNRLEVTSRRLIAWNMGITCTALFLGLGYPYWFNLRQHRRGVQTAISRPICWFAVVICWGIVIVFLSYFFVSTLSK
jgi:hypothetical protein